jgi:SanA protein
MKIFLIILGIFVALVAIGIVAVNMRIASYANGRVYSNVADVPNDDRVALVLGARVRNGEPSDMLYDRLLAGAELYKAGKTSKLLLSGGGDEPAVMKRLTLEFGAPEADIIVDELGVRTYESCVRAKENFQITRVIVVTQDYHLARSLYLCQNLGVDAIGLNATRRPYDSEGFAWNREYLSRVRAWWDVNF